jgi:tetratricopeptide (TPR) repeat protein
LYYRGAMALAKTNADRRAEMSFTVNMANAFGATHQMDSALAYNRTAIALAATDSLALGRALLNFGSAFAQIGRSDSARIYHERALIVTHAIGDTAAEATTLMSLGNSYRGPGQQDSAIVFKRRVAALDHAVREYLAESVALRSIGDSFLIKGDRDSALAYYHKALDLQRSMNNESNVGGTLSYIASFFARVAQWDSALVYFRQSLATTKATMNRSREQVVLGQIAEVYRRRGELDSAFAYYDQSAVSAAELSRSTGADFNRVTFNETLLGLYSSWSLVALARANSLSGEAGDSHRRAAIAAAERGKAQALLDLMRDSTSPRPSAGGDLAREGADLLSAVATPNSATIAYVLTSDTLLIFVARPGIPMYVERVAIRADSLSRRVAELRASLQVDASTVLASRGAALEATNPAFAPSGQSRWNDVAIRVASLLFPPSVARALAGARELLIIPQGTLGMLPFATLPFGPSGELLGQTFALRYGPSLATVARAQARPAIPSSELSQRLKQAIIFSNPAMPDVQTASGERSALAALPGADAEGRAVAKYLDVTVHTGGSATETAARRLMPSAPVIHLATHGVAYAKLDRTRDSFIALAAGDGNDGRLTVAELLDDSSLKLSAELVVLSACQTGLGDMRIAEGTVGLQRAFLAKGARTLVVSLWNVSDAATTALMDAFYRHWLRDSDAPTKSDALRRAQDDVRRTPGWEHPRFWAAFQLVGAA